MDSSKGIVTGRRQSEVQNSSLVQQSIDVEWWVNRLTVWGDVERRLPTAEKRWHEGRYGVRYVPIQQSRGFVMIARQVTLVVGSQGRTVGVEKSIPR